MLGIIVIGIFSFAMILFLLEIFGKFYNENIEIIFGISIYLFVLLFIVYIELDTFKN